MIGENLHQIDGIQEGSTHRAWRYVNIMWRWINRKKYVMCLFCI